MEYTLPGEWLFPSFLNQELPFGNSSIRTDNCFSCLLRTNQTCRFRRHLYSNLLQMTNLKPPIIFNSSHKEANITRRFPLPWSVFCHHNPWSIHLTAGWKTTTGFKNSCDSVVPQQLADTRANFAPTTERQKANFFLKLPVAFLKFCYFSKDMEKMSVHAKRS